MTRELVTNFVFELYTPSFALAELSKHKVMISAKAGLSAKGFEEILEKLCIFIKIEEDSDYSGFLNEAHELCPDPDDVDFFAIALKYKCPLWSNDAALKKQLKIRGLSTKDVLEIVG